jgi:hypothetical protein
MPTNHPKPSAKNTEGDTRKVLKPSKEVRLKMQPLSRLSFDSLLRKAITTPALKHA